MRSARDTPLDRIAARRALGETHVLGLPEAAHLLMISKRRVQQLRSEGKLSAESLPSRNVRTSLDELERVAREYYGYV